MKILRLKGQNINSLKGDFEIDFENFLADDALFAITGPTGSGKSTILDVITCALYGRTPRLKNPNELMARHTGECLCEVEFEIKGEIYRSSWTLKRARKNAEGRFQSAKMEVSNVFTGKVIESGLRDVPDYIEALSGLDFERFSQSMMLAQGSFDAFLKAKEGDRSSLLEKITGTQIYAKISKEIYDTYAIKKVDIESDKKLVDSIELLDADVLDERTKQLQEDRVRKLSCDKKEKELLKVKSWLETLITLELDSKKYHELFDAVSKEKETKKEEFTKLSLANRALDVEVIHSQYETLVNDIDKDTTRHKDLITEISELKEKLKVEELAYESSQKKSQKAKVNFDVQTGKIKELRALQTQIEAHEKTLEGLSVKIELEQSEEQKEKENLALTTTEYTTISSVLSEATNYLNAHAKDESLKENLPLMAKNITEYAIEMASIVGRETKQRTTLANETLTLESLKSIKELCGQAEIAYAKIERDYKILENATSTAEQEQGYRERLAIIAEVLKAIDEYRDIKEGAKQENQTLSNTTEEMRVLNDNIAYKKTLIIEIENHITTLRKQKDTELLVAKYEEDRAKLVKDEPCALCGSTTHPYVNHELTINIVETTNFIEEKEQQLKRENVRLKELEQSLTKCDAKIETCTSEISKLEKDKQRLESLFTKHRVNIDDETKQNLEEEKESIRTTLSQIVKNREDKEQLLKQKEKAYKVLHAKEAEVSANVKELEILGLDKKRLEEEKQRGIVNQQNLEATLANFFGSYNSVFDDDYEQSYKALEAKKEAYEEKLKIEKAYITKLHEKTVLKKELETNLKNLETSLQKQKKEHLEIALRVNTLREKSRAILEVESVDDYELEVNATFNKVEDVVNAQRETVTQSRTKEEGLVKQENSLATELIANKQKLVTLKQTLEVELKKNGFENVDAFKNAILPKEKREVLATQCKGIEDKYKEYLTLKTDTTTKLTEHTKEILSEKPRDEVAQELVTLKEIIDTLQKEIGASEAILEHNSKESQKHQAKIEELEKKSEAFKVWVKLNDMVGSADGNKFAKFAQGITLDQLISLANNHLLHLSSRYELQRSMAEKQLLDLEVIDGYQGNVVRSVSTLSGGESFIVSLSLALGLSELASNKIAIDSLFLDEGFGSLDEESLETALTALNMLQSKGKMVGVISHVEALKERIPLQIKVVPNGDGTSFIKI